jgi:hypothetical protein
VHPSITLLAFLLTPADLHRLQFSSIRVQMCRRLLRAVLLLVAVPAVGVVQMEEGVRDVTDEYKSHLERELMTLTTELATLLESSLLRAVMSPEPQIFYRKLVGDFYRYLAEISVPGAAGLNAVPALTYCSLLSGISDLYCTLIFCMFLPQCFHMAIPLLP